MKWSKEIFAKNLAYYIEISGKTQREVANIIGVSAPTMSDWVNGKIFPRIDKIEMLANYFGILKSDLLENKTKDQKNEKQKMYEKMWADAVGDIELTVDEIEKLISYTKFLISSRK